MTIPTPRPQWSSEKFFQSQSGHGPDLNRHIDDLIKFIFNNSFKAKSIKIKLINYIEAYTIMNENNQAINVHIHSVGN